MKRIELGGKHAVGEHRFTLVDDEDYAELSQYRWKAKPNGGGNHVYAVRSAWLDGKCITVRMHREILGLSKGDPRDVDHINHDALDNRRQNLRAVSRSVNCRNRRIFRSFRTCAQCGVEFQHRNRDNQDRENVYCTKRCRLKATHLRLSERVLHDPLYGRKRWSRIYFYRCGECTKLFTSRRRRNTHFCSRRCFDRYRSRGGPRVGERKCTQCDEVFTPKRKSKIYCSKRCIKRAARQRDKQGR